ARIFDFRGQGGASRGGMRSWHSPLLSAKYTATAWQSQGSSAGRPGLQLVLFDLLAEGVAVHAQLQRGLGDGAPVVLEHAGDEALLELAPGFREQDALLDHLRDQGVELLLHGLAPDPFPRKGAQVCAAGRGRGVSTVTGR